MSVKEDKTFQNDHSLEGKKTTLFISREKISHILRISSQVQESLSISFCLMREKQFCRWPRKKNMLIWPTAYLP